MPALGWADVAELRSARATPAARAKLAECAFCRRHSDLPAMDSQWLFPLSALSHTPSGETSNISLEDELRDRAKGVEFMFRVAAQLALSNTVFSAAAQYFHRFYMRYSVEDFPPKEVAAASVFLATKTEESSRKLKNVAYICYTKATGRKDNNTTEVQRWQNNILATEECLLDALCFDFIVDHPHPELIDLLAAACANETLEQYAWTLINDSLRTPLCVLQPPRIIATACFILAQRIEEGLESASLDDRIFSRSSASLPTPPHMHPRSPPSGNLAQVFFQLSESEMEAVAITVTMLLEFYATLVAQDEKYQHIRPLADIAPPMTPPGYSGLYRIRPNTDPPPAPDGLPNDNAASPNDGGITPASMGRTPHRSGWTPVHDQASTPVRDTEADNFTPSGDPPTAAISNDGAVPQPDG